MSRFKRVLPVVAAIALCAPPAGAQVTGRPIEVSGGAGRSHFDARARLKDGWTFGGALGWRLKPDLTLEGDVLFAPGEEDHGAQLKRNFSYAGLDLRWNLRRASGRVVPFVLTGVGYGLSHGGNVLPNRLGRGAASVGLGLLLNVRDQRTYVRLQVRDVMFQERGVATGFNHDLAATVGLHFVLRGSYRDTDFDGVRDWIDHCPGTPVGAKVDATGCPIDSDGDGVYDGLDPCPGTPKGCVTDSTGCPIDSDGDGVCDGLDKCPDTPKGATVDSTGCPSDSDGDGVLDGIDQCPNTPKGATVDAKGCPSDTDGDGVPDGIDQCPNTPKGMAVGANGCKLELSPLEVQLLTKGEIRLPKIEFEATRAVLRPEALPLLDQLAVILPQYPDLQFELGGYTDDSGDPELNQQYSLARAKAVLDYLKQKSPVPLADAQFKIKGYGATRDTTYQGRIRSRRVELKVLNPDQLAIERAKRMPAKEENPTPPPADDRH